MFWRASPHTIPSRFPSPVVNWEMTTTSSPPTPSLHISNTAARRFPCCLKSSYSCPSVHSIDPADSSRLILKSQGTLHPLYLYPSASLSTIICEYGCSSSLQMAHKQVSEDCDFGGRGAARGGRRAVDTCRYHQTESEWRGEFTIYGFFFDHKLTLKCRSLTISTST